MTADPRGATRTLPGGSFAVAPERTATVRQYLPRVIAAASEASARTYST